MATSLMRAAHTRLSSAPLIEDPWGEKLLSDAERKELPLEPLLDHPVFATVIVRSRYTEDALRAAVAGGVRQYVVVGAGMDSLALRRPDFAAELEIVELDLPGTQAMKLQRLRDRGVALPRGVHYIAADLSREPLDHALARSPFRPEVPAFFAWLGVASYLTREANLATLRAIAASAAPGSELVFTYIERRELDPKTASGDLETVRAGVAASGEPWVSGFDPSTLADDLAAAGLALVEDLDGELQRQRYCARREDDLRPVPTIHVARARPAP
jgi:methyltransferase (TIGR00027 family)